MDGLDTSVGSTPSGEQGASPAPAAASGGIVEGQGDGNGQPAGQPPAVDPSQSASVPAEGDAAVTPGTDPAQPEGETPAVPQLRAHVQTLETDLNNWKGLGSFEEVKSDVGLVNAIYGDDPKAAWAQLQAQSPDTVIRLFDAAFDIKEWQPFFIDAAKQRGWIPQADATQPQFQPAQVTPAELSVLDPKYHEMYPHLSAQERYEIQMEEDPAKQARMLETHLKAFKHDQMLAQHDEQLKTEKEQRHNEQTARLGQDFRDAVWGGVTQQLADKLKPTGNPQIDGKLGEVVRTWAEFATARDAAAQSVLGQLYQAIDGLETRKAMSLAAPVQAHAARLIGEFLDGLAPIFDGYHKYLQSQRGNGDNRVEAPLPGGNLPQQPNNGQLPANAGEYDPENLRRYSREIFG
jgi:hypothetical protein